MSEHLTWCKSLQEGTAKDCNCSGLATMWNTQIANLTAENSRLRKAIEAAIKQQESIGGGELLAQGTTVRILKAALEGK